MGFVSEEDNVCLHFFIKFINFYQNYYILGRCLEYTYFSKFTLCSSGLWNGRQPHPASSLLPCRLAGSSELDHKVKVILFSFFVKFDVHNFMVISDVF